MDLPAPLIPGRLLRRYKRFLADVALDGGGEVTAHCPNSGSMMGLSAPGLRVWLSHSGNPRRKLAHTLELVEADGTLVGIHTGRPNRLAEEAILAGTVAPLAGYTALRREVPYAVNSRVDLLLGHAERPDCYVEVKNVHLRRPHGPHPTAAEFPDCVTARGAKHLGALSGVCAAGMRAVLLYIVQRADCDHFRLADDLDPVYAAGAKAAAAAGVEFLCYGCDVQPSGIAVSRPLSVVV
ncbi:MAG: DNA/RNA nuclease SfsA [Rhodospirillaceae bacterium]|nr:DNA/RNA nuclease SfsA [Rhodospirillaceae bacterium]MCA8931074.1 DNA/RNA nuclease SfsA [Rhodospirillaceae bacterium]